MTPDDRARLRANAEAAIARTHALNGTGGAPEYADDERPHPDEVLALLDEIAEKENDQ